MHWPSNAKYLYLVPAQIPNVGIMRNGHCASPTLVSVGTFTQSCCIILLSGKSSDISKSTLIFQIHRVYFRQCTVNIKIQDTLNLCEGSKKDTKMVKFRASLRNLTKNIWSYILHQQERPK